SSTLEQMFAPYGTVQSAQVITDRDTGRSKGFGFVEMSSDAEAQAAIAALNGTEKDGRTLTGKEARPKTDRGGAGPRGGGRRPRRLRRRGRRPALISVCFQLSEKIPSWDVPSVSAESAPFRPKRPFLSPSPQRMPSAKTSLHQLLSRPGAARACFSLPGPP